MRSSPFQIVFGFLVAAVAGCGGGTQEMPAPDGGAGDMATWCRFQPVPKTAGAGGTVEAGALTAGAAEVLLDLPVGTALGGFTGRAMAIGGLSDVDSRTVEQSGKFFPSIGIETVPRVKAIALAAGGENVVLLKVDLIFSVDAATFDVAERLGPAYAGKVVFATSHSHSAPGQFTINSALGVGVGRYRSANYKRLVDRMVEAAQAAIAARRPATIGIAHDGNFDPADDVNRDRRGENDVLAGGKRKDHDLFVIRIDGADKKPIAIVDVIGVHGTIMDADNPLMSTDAPGAIERALEESFDDQVVAMHLQGAAGDVSPAGRGGIDRTGDVANFNFARSESVGRLARPMILDVWAKAGQAMQPQIAMEMVTREVPLGPDASTFTVRKGALRYAPFEAGRVCDGNIYGPNKEILSPIDEFNAPVGAALCGGSNILFPMSDLPGTGKLLPYRSCMVLDVASEYLGRLLDLPFEPLPVCASTRTTVSALRLGADLIAFLPGEPLTLLADKVRSLSPLPPEHTIVVGYAQGHVGYLLTADDWLLAGYEPSINFWGPLEGEYIAERAGDLMALAMTPTREDTGTGSIDRLLADPAADKVPPPDPSPMRGTIPKPVPDLVYLRGPTHPASAQPDSKVPRLGSARFVWIGEDPMEGTPRVMLQRKNEQGAFADVTRRSGRKVMDRDLLLTWTPSPLRRKTPIPRTHYWGVEWQAVAISDLAGADDLEDRAGVPTGTYRFHVVGTGYDLTSDPFAVEAAALSLAGSVMNGKAQIDVAYDGAGGWRLLDYSAPSNGKVPARRGPFDVELRFMSGQSQMQMGVAGTAGHLSLDVPNGEKLVKALVTDRFGNKGEVSF